MSSDDETPKFAGESDKDIVYMGTPVHELAKPYVESNTLDCDYCDMPMWVDERMERTARKANKRICTDCAVTKGVVDGKDKTA